MEQVSLLQDCVMLTFTEEVMHKCLHFSCGDEDLNSFFTEDTFLYAEEMLGKTYCWVTKEKPYRIVDKQRILNYYANNGFKFLFKTEEDEKHYYEVDANSDIHTRLMYFDLKSRK